LVRLPLNWVEYDNDPERVLEPLNHIGNFRQITGAEAGNYLPVNPFTDGVGLMAGIEVFDALPFAEVFEYHMV